MQLVTPDGSIPTLKPEEHQLDNILLGRQLLLLYRVTQNKRYLTAATFLYDQLEQQPRTPIGGFWHKQRYPNQMWLDGLYMAEPFYAEYASISHHPEEFNDITHQFVLMEEHVRDPKTGLLYHGWDESKQERWANKQTGDSPQFWARGMGWYMMALVDTLDYYPDRRSGPRATDRYPPARSAPWRDYQDRKDRPLVRRARQTRREGQLLRVLGLVHVCLRICQRRAARLFAGALILANAERGYKGILSHFIKSGRTTMSR